MSAKNVNLLSHVMGFPKVVKRERVRCKQCRNGDGCRRLCGKYTARVEMSATNGLPFYTICDFT